MPLPAALPFQMRRSHDVYGVAEITSTTERIHGLLRLEREHLVVQWRIARQTERVGSEIRTDHEVEAVQEVVLPLNALGGSVVQRVRWPWPWTPRLVLRASDLRAFEEIAGAAGLRLDHPATLVLGIQRRESLAALEFSAELNLEVAEHLLIVSHGMPNREALRPAVRKPLPPSRAGDGEISD
ncbi:hypothetical protein BH23GEM8_BH23GEM8_01450 [soil metagenome]